MAIICGGRLSSFFPATMLWIEIGPGSRRLPSFRLARRLDVRQFIAQIVPDDVLLVGPDLLLVDGARPRGCLGRGGENQPGEE